MIDKIRPKTLQVLLAENTSVVLLNVFTPEVFQKCHIGQSINVCIYELAFKKKILEIVPDMNTPIVVYGLNNQFLAGAKAVNKLQAIGYRSVQLLDGGLEEWRNEGYPVVEGLPDYEHNTEEKRVVKVDLEKSNIRWTGRNLANSHWGYVTIRSGALELKGETILGGCFEIDMTSLTCEDLELEKGGKGLLRHLASSDFWASAEHPTAHVTITEINSLESATWGKPNVELICDLDIRGVSYPLVFSALVGFTEECKLVAQGQLKFDRTCYGSRYGSGKFFEFLGKHMVADFVEIDVLVVEA